MTPLRVMVTGAGSIVGQGIVKALRYSGLPVHIIATDIAPLNAALFRADEGQVTVKVEAADALPRFIETLRRLKADALMIGSEFDLMFFARNKEVIEQETGTVVVVSPLQTVELADDKLKTAEFLRDHGIAHAQACAVTSAAQASEWGQAKGYPLMLKSRQGTSARHVHIVADKSELQRLLPDVPNPMLQQMAGPIDSGLGHEYTCSVFRCRDGVLHGPFVSRRTLRGGSSWLVEVAPEPAADALMREIGKLVPSVGSLNVQMMISNGRAVPFELNARFSGTTPIRAYFGFNEPEMAVRSYVLKETVPAPQIRSGMAIRYVEEVFLDGVRADDLMAPLPKGRVMHWF
jgi:carbamoyl-phosphate synthase large subunit